MEGLYIMENPIKMDDLGGFPMIFGLTPICHHPFELPFRSSAQPGKAMALTYLDRFRSKQNVGPMI